MPLAKSFCSVGGAYGPYDPPVKGECNRIADPYAELNSPRPGKCIPSIFYDNPFKKKKKTGQPVKPGTPLSGLSSGMNLSSATEFRLLKTYGTQLLNIPPSENVVSHDKVLWPGTYCGGLTVDGNNVRFLKGTYIIKDGPLTIKNGSIAKARDVTFVMHGPEAVVRIERGAKFMIKAPKKGKLAGIAFMQARDGTNVMQTANTQYPNGLNLLRSGGELDVIGTIYFPTQAVDVSGDSRVGAQSPATSFIAYQVAFAGQTRTTVGVDHVAAGLPPLLPQADDAARLIK